LHPSTVTFSVYLTALPPDASVTQGQKRVDLRRNALEGLIDWARDVVISDESRFGRFDDGRRRWIPRGEYPDESFVSPSKHPQSVMV
jgi:hypothetical protein